MNFLMDKTLRDYSDVLASKEPAPGGGSTAALSGVLAASLTMMVVNLSQGKKAYEALDESIKETFMSHFKKVEELKAHLTFLVDEDTAAFNRFMEAMKMPKETDEQKQARQDKMDKAALYALEIPLKTAEACFEILKKQKHIAEYGNKNAISDIGVGALLALAGMEGAILNVKINLPGIKDEALKAAASEKCRLFTEEGKAMQQEVLAVVKTRME